MPSDPRPRARALSGWISAISGLLAFSAGALAVHAGANREPGICLAASLATAAFLGTSLRTPRR